MFKSLLMSMFAVAIVFGFVSCKQNSSHEKRPDSSLKAVVVKHERDKVGETGEPDADSLAFDKILQEAFRIAVKNSGNNIFTTEYEVVSEADGLPLVAVNIDLGYHFTKTSPHLIIRRKDPGTVRIDIFSKRIGKFEKAFSVEQWSMEYMGDTIRDINGDGRKDFVVNWYGSNGCCLKAFSNVYLLRHDEVSFAKNIEFINPTFSLVEGIVRGVCYGYRGETEMYKYKWNGEVVDTIEYVYYEMNDKGAKTGQVVLSTGEPYSKGHKVIKVLNAIPKEYYNIGGYDWFSGGGWQESNKMFRLYSLQIEY